MSHPATTGSIPLRELPEKELLRRCRARGGEEAASELLGRHRQQVYLWCRRMLRDEERALDLSQEVLLAAYRGLERFDGRCRVSTWLFTIARNRCLNELARPQLLWDPEVEPDHCRDTAAGPEQGLLDQEDEDAVLELIRRHLDPLEQRALWMRCFERMPVDAITEALHLRERSGARALLQRARRKLRTALAERTRTEGGEKWTSAAS